MEQEPEVQENRQGVSRSPAPPADGPDNTLLPESPAGGRDGEATGRRIPSSALIDSRDGGGEGGPAGDAEEQGGHEPPLIDETGAGAGDKDEETSKEPTELAQPEPREGSSTRAVAVAEVEAEASCSPPLKASNVVGADGEGDRGAVGLLDEAPEEKCHVG